jgi:hypothetical protein
LLVVRIVNFKKNDAKISKIHEIKYKDPYIFHFYPQKSKNRRYNRQKRHRIIRMGTATINHRADDFVIILWKK